MIFVCGGRYSGKRDFVRNKMLFEEVDLTSKLFEDLPVFYGLELCTMAQFAEEERVFSYLKTREVVICQELGCGLLSMDKEVRIHQETVARMCRALSWNAESVYRVQGGLGLKIR